MSYPETTTMATASAFNLPTMAGLDFGNDDLADDMEGLTLSFPKVKIPSGGALQFEMPTGDPENPEYTRFLHGVILYHHASGAYWPEGCEYDDNTVPLCSTVDGKQGYGTPGGACAACELNRYGTATDGKGKACKNMRILYLLQDGDYIPLQLSLPPTSLRPFNDFMNAAFVARRRPAWSSVVQIGLKRVDNGNNTYSVATFRKVEDLQPEQVGEFRAFVESFRQQAKEMLKSRAELSASMPPQTPSMLLPTAASISAFPVRM